MNNISKILTVIIFSGLFFLNKQHLEQKQLITITIFIGLIVLLRIVSNYKNSVKENLENLKILSGGKYELQVVSEHKTPNESKVDWKVDNYHMQRLKELGLEDNDEDEFDIISRL